MAARATFSHESRMVKMPLPSSVLLKDYLLDDLSSCSSNGFRSYPRRQCCTKVRYLIEIDLNKHVKLPQANKNVRKNKSKPKLKLKASLVNVFKSFKFSGTGSGSGSKKTKFLPRNLSRKLSMNAFWKRSSNQEKKEIKKLNSFDESIKCKENILPPVASITTEKSSSNSISISNSNSNNSPTSSDSSFTITSNSSTTCGYSKTNVARNKTKESEPFGVEKTNATNEENVVVTTTATTITSTDNAKDKFQGAQKNEFSPISVIEFPSDNDNYNDDEDEVTSPFQRNSFYAKGCKRRHKSKVQKTKSLAQLNPVRLEDRITLSESGTQGTLMLESSSQTRREFVAEKRALALLQLLKATMSSHGLSESPMTERVLLGFFAERFIEGNVSNYIILQEAKDWINGQIKEVFELQNNKVAYIKEMEKGVKWLNYSEEETREVVSELEYEVFTSLVEEILLEWYL